MLTIHRIIKDLEEALAKNPEPVANVADKVAKGEKVIGKATPELAALYNLLDQATKSGHKTDAQIANAKAADKAAEDIQELVYIRRQLDDYRETLHQLFYHEVRMYLNDFKNPGLGIRAGNTLVALPVSASPSLDGMPKELKKLLAEMITSEESEGDVETND